MVETTGGLAIYGAAVGTLALCVSVANYRRDRGKLHLTLSFDRFRHDGGLLQREPHIRVDIVNTGRRPVLVTMVVVDFGFKSFMIDEVTPTRLEESGQLVAYLPYEPELEAILTTMWWRAEAIAFGPGHMYRASLPRFQPSRAIVPRPGRFVRGWHNVRTTFLINRGRLKRFLGG